MPWICLNCDNKTEFRQLCEYQQWYSEYHYMDENLDVNDYGDADYGDSEYIDGGRIECCKCDSSDVEEVSNEEWEGWEGNDYEYCEECHHPIENGRCIKCHAFTLLAEQFEF